MTTQGALLSTYRYANWFMIIYDVQDEAQCALHPIQLLRI